LILRPELDTASRACSLLRSLLPPPKPATASRACYRVKSLLSPPEPCSLLRCLLPPPKLATASRARNHVQSLLPHPELALSSEACCLKPSEPQYTFGLLRMGGSHSDQLPSQDGSHLPRAVSSHARGPKVQHLCDHFDHQLSFLDPNCVIRFKQNPRSLRSAACIPT